nr:glycosyl hydrolase family 28 protein [Halostagnicola larsenii]
MENPRRAPNGDGIDINSAQHVRISDTYVHAGNDAICIKSGKNAEGHDVGRLTSAITVTKYRHVRSRRRRNRERNVR